jgi:hypothetical protein
VIILSPKGAVSAESIALMPPMGDLSGRVVGILNNGHHNGTPVLEAMRDILLAHHRVARVLFRTKPWISRPAPDEVLQELRGSCDDVIAGVGD